MIELIHIEPEWPEVVPQEFNVRDLALKLNLLISSHNELEKELNKTTKWLNALQNKVECLEKRLEKLEQPPYPYDKEFDVTFKIEPLNPDCRCGPVTTCPVHFNH